MHSVDRCGDYPDPGATLLRQLADELAAHGWRAELRGTHELHVRNPKAAKLAEIITWQQETLCWSWGEPIGRSKVAEVAARIRHVLREVDA